MLDKWKLQDDGSLLAKSRNVLIGWKDPMIYQLERRAPTPTQDGDYGIASMVGVIQGIRDDI